MKIKKSLLVISLIVAGTHGLPAQTAPSSPTATATPSWSFTVTPTFVSQYMFRGVRLGGSSFEPAIEADYGNLALGVWSNWPIKDKVSGQSDPEIDPYGSYKFVASDALSIQPGFTWYTYVKANQNNGFYKETFEPNLAVNYTVSGLTFTPKIYYDVVLRGATYEFNAAYAVPLKDLGTELDFGGTLGTYKWTASAENTTPAVKNWGDYWLLGISAPFQVAKDQKLTLGWAYTEGRANYFKQGTAARTGNSAAVGRGVVTVSYAWSF
jgi:uncharacterized protein (TIGR02001 family)